jgi:hypothetical protein
MKRWLTTVSACNWDTLDVCGLFEDQELVDEPSTEARDDTALRLTHHG